MDEVIKASAVVLAGNRLGAGTIGEQLFEDGERLADAVRAGERPEIPSAVVFHAPRQINQRKILADVYLDERIRLVVLEPRVVLRLALFD